MSKDNFERSLNSEIKWKAIVANNYQNLRNYDSLNICYPTVIPELPQDYYSRNQRDVSLQTAVIPLVMAMDLFWAGQYEACAREMASLEAIVYRLGGNRSLRCFFQSILVES